MFSFRFKCRVLNAIDFKCFEPLNKRTLSIINPSRPDNIVTQVESGSTATDESIRQSWGGYINIKKIYEIGN